MAERAVAWPRTAPTPSTPWAGCGRSGALDVGVKTLREARQRAPESREIRYHLAWALHRSGQRDAARSELAAALGGRGPSTARPKPGSCGASSAYERAMSRPMNPALPLRETPMKIRTLRALAALGLALAGIGSAAAATSWTLTGGGSETGALAAGNTPATPPAATP
jgi:hypothetical protein